MKNYFIVRLVRQQLPCELRYYTGMSGQGFAGSFSRAYRYETSEAAERRCQLINNYSSLHGLRGEVVRLLTSERTV